jgi:hypothetical protein
MFVVHHRPQYNNRSRAEVSQSQKFIFRSDVQSDRVKENALPQCLARPRAAKPVNALWNMRDVTVAPASPETALPIKKAGAEPALGRIEATCLSSA